jgi:hypothetical protein
MVSEKRSQSQASHKTSKSELGIAGGGEVPLVPETTRPGAKFGGFGFGRQGEKVAADEGFKISRPIESLPGESVLGRGIGK